MRAKIKKRGDLLAPGSCPLVPWPVLQQNIVPETRTCIFKLMIITCANMRTWKIHLAAND